MKENNNRKEIKGKALVGMLLIGLVLGAVSVSCDNWIVSAEDSKDIFLFEPWVDGLEANINFAIYTPCNNMHWDWGDGSESDGFFGTHLYSKSGNYIVTVTLDTKEKGRISEKIEVTVDATKSAEDLEEPNNLHRLTLFSPEVSGLRVTINGVVVAPAERIEWDWGDGQKTVSLFAATHTYLHSRTYTVKVTVYDKKGRTTTKEVKVTLSPSSEVLKSKSVMKPASVQAQNEAGLVGDWHFDEGSGNTVKDSSGNGNDGKIYGATFVDGISGYALNFDGIDDYVLIMNEENFDITEQITIEAWVNWKSGARGIDMIVDKGGLVYWFIIDSGDSISICVTDDIDNNIYGTGVSFIPYQGIWTYAVGTYDGKVIKLYVDGKLVNLYEYKGKIVTDDLPLRIGANEVNRDTFEGKIDEVRIYNRALSAEEISTIYNNYTKKKENQEIASNLINSVPTKIDALKRKNMDTSVIEQALNKAKDSYESEKYDEAYELAQNVQKMADNAYVTFGHIESAQSEIEAAKSIGADITDAESKLKDAKEALNKGNYEYAMSWADEALELAKHASIGSVKIIDLKALTTKYDQRTVVVSGTIRDIKTVYGKGYTFALDDGSGMISVVYEGGLGDIQEGDKITVSGVFQASSGSVVADIVQKAGVGGVPGFEAIFAIAGMMAVAYLIRRRKEG